MAFTRAGLKTFLFPAGLTFLTVIAGAQQPTYKNFNIDDGLAGSSVFYAFQDSRGFIWFATSTGLSRFDGTNFTNYTTADGLTDNEVFTIHEDSEGRIWFLNYTGIPCYYYNQQIYNPENEPMLRKFRFKQFLRSFTEDHNQRIWLSDFGNVVHSLDSLGNTFTYPDIQKKKITRISGLFTDDRRQVNIIGHMRLDNGPDRNTLYYNLENNTYQISEYLNNYQRCSYYDIAADNSLIRVADEGLIMYRSQKEKLIFSFENTPHIGLVNIVAFDKQENIFFATNKQVVQLKKIDKEWQVVRTLLHGENVASVLHDREGNYWFTTLGNGVFYTPSLDVVTYTENDELNSNKIYDVVPDQSGGIWFGSDRGSYYVLKDGQLNAYNLGIAQIFGQGRVRRIIPVEEGGAWLLTDLGLFRTRAYIATSYQINAKALTVDRDGTTWVAMPHLVFGSQSLYGLRIKHLENYKEVIRIPEVRSTSLVMDEQGRLFIGSLRGLMVWDGDTLTKVFHEQKILSQQITDIRQSVDSSLWIATSGRGLVRIKHDEILQISRKNGLSSDICKRLFTDEDTIWVATNKGLNKVSVDGAGQIKIRVYNSLDGLASDEVNGVCKKGKEIFVATAKGLTIFRESDMNNSLFSPPIYMTDLQAVGHSLPIHKMNTIPFRDNNIKIVFKGISFRKGNQLQYKYRISNLDTNWQYTRSDHVEIPSMQAGLHTFEVMAAHQDGDWSPEPAVISFQILHPYWQTWWFILLVIFLGVDLVIVFIILAIKRIRKNERKKALINQKIAESELKALRSQMNPHFISNSLNSIQRFIIKNNLDDAYDYLQKFGTLIRMILESSKYQTVPLSMEIKSIQLYLELESLRFDNKFNYTISSNFDLEETEFKIPALLIQPYVENAIWHGIMPRQDGGSVDIQVEKKDNFLVCTITDDGIGRHRSMELKSKHQQKRSSTGMKVTLDRLKILNSQKNSNLNVEITDLRNDRGEASGTKVELFIPL